MIILNLTEKIISSIKILIVNKIRILNLKCTPTNKINQYINANNSTKSQFHQPPQDNSCSAHQQPNRNANSTKIFFFKKYLVLIYIRIFKIFIFFLKKYTSTNKISIVEYDVYNNNGCISIKPFSKLLFKFAKLIGTQKNNGVLKLVKVFVKKINIIIIKKLCAIFANLLVVNIFIRLYKEDSTIIHITLLLLFKNVSV